MTGTLSFGERIAAAERADEEERSQISADCPHAAGTPEAVAWWQAQWNLAIERGDVEPRLDQVPTSTRLPPFPVERLPPVMRRVVQSVAENKQVPVDVTALIALACVSVVAGPRVIIDRGKDWREPVIEWTLPILESGERKTPAADVFIRGVLKRIEKRFEEEHAGLVVKEIELIRSEIDALSATRKGMSKDEQTRLSEQVKKLNEKVEKLEEARPPQLLLGGSSTPEAIEAAMSRNGGAIAILDDEGGAFGIVAGIYNNGVPTGVDTLLKGYSGSYVPPNERVKRSVEGIPRAVLTYGISTQPEVIAESFRSVALRRRGFHARWLYAIPDSMVGRTVIDPPELDRGAVREFESLLYQTTREMLPIDGHQPDWEWPALQLSPDARRAHMDLQARFAPRTDADTGDLGFMSDWANKYVGRVLRHAGLLHIAAGRGLGEAVSLETMQDAIAIGEWALVHAAEVFRRAPKTSRPNRRDTGNASMVGVPKVLRWIAANRPVKFTARDVFNAVRKQSWCEEAADVQDVLKALQVDGLVRSVPRTGKDGRELPGAPWWIAHPDLVYGE